MSYEKGEGTRRSLQVKRKQAADNDNMLNDSVDGDSDRKQTRVDKRLKSSGRAVIGDFSHSRKHEFIVHISEPGDKKGTVSPASTKISSKAIRNKTELK